MRHSRVLLTVLMTAALLAGCRAGAGAPPAREQSGQLAGQVTTTRVVAVGDIACPPGGTPTATSCRQGATARLATSLDPDLVIGLGDLQYERGSYYQFAHSYDRSWGALKRITRPLPGNHEYKTPGAAGYYRYFDRTAPGWYSYAVGGWRVYHLNSNCGEVNCDRELTWLENQLDDHPTRCSIIAMHHPRFSSGDEHGNSLAVRPFWQAAYRHHVDIALAGHDHDYERFVRLTPSGERSSRGIVSYVSGAGGKSLYRLGTRQPGSAYFNGRRFGVLQLDLAADSWTWRYRTIDGVVRDWGTRSCI
jgi:hypothetical protein